ncbi:hypothetical protein ACVWWI_002587 [Bradyrhizobium sp. USDA 3686]|uniref:hypothetical protein n=1 Tax=Bradyrhizobium TaxID=374 RepID=UPI001957AC9F|nr:hypothetical protein [Bradyrhizobium canariense]MBM7484094.1 hypothetical protein [Bradyrhizobium canariense]UFW74719.1 hypothetical protein BcanWU425_13540 [Bradyrhizobium canariense]
MSGLEMRISVVEYVGELSTFFGRSVRKRLIAILSGTLVAMLIAFLVSRMLPTTYTATADVRLARVDGADLMTPQATATHMNLRAFLIRALDAPGLAEGRADRGRGLIPDSFYARLGTSSSLTLIATAASEQQARNALEAAVRQLNQDQEKLRDPLLSELNGQLTLANTNIASLMRIRESLATTDSITPSASGDSVALAFRRVWLLDLMAKNEEKLAAATVEQRALTARIGLTKTYPASLSDDVVIVQVSPQPLRHAIFAGAIALLAMVLYAMIRMPGPARAD